MSDSSTTIQARLRELKIDVGRKTSGNARSTCPQCSATRKKSHVKSLSVDFTETGVVGHCHHCAWSFAVGDKITDRVITKKAFQRPAYTLDQQELEPKVIAWFDGRGITADVLMRNRIGYGPVWMPQEDKEVGAIAFPYYRNGEVVNVKYRSGKKSFRMETGAELCLYGLDDIKTSQVIVVEGEIDKLSVEVAGLTACVSIPNGAPAPDAKHFERHFSYLSTVDLSAITRFVIAVDNDEPGRVLRDELVRRLGPERCWLVDWPEGCKDANDVLVKHGADNLKLLLDEPRPFPLSGVVEARDVASTVLDVYRNGYPPGASPGTPVLEHYYTVRPGQISIITGIPSHGKSAWVDWVCYNLAKNHGWQIALCSPENHPVSEHVIKYLELYTGRPFAGGSNRMTAAEIAEGIDWIHDHMTFISPEDEIEDWTPKGILKIARSLVLRKGIKGLVLDPWNEFDHSRRDGMTETEHISQSLSVIRKFARAHQVHVWIVAHPFKLRKQESDGKYPIPSLYEISGSSHWYNKADMGVAIYRDPREPAQPVKVDVQKVRFKRCGRVGTHEMAFDRLNNRYSDAADVPAEI